MQAICQEYTNWRDKIDIIEQKMQEENQRWKKGTESLQRENEKLQKEALKMAQKCADLQGKLEKAEKKASTLAAVEEAVCLQCKESMEESQIMNSSRRHSTENQELTQKLEQALKESSQLKEQVNYLQTLDAEMKKNFEGQVDVVLKMEEERLTLLKQVQAMGEQVAQTEERMTQLKTERDQAEEKVTELQAKMEETTKKVDEFEQELLNMQGGEKKPGKGVKKAPPVKKPLKFQQAAKQTKPVDVSVASSPLSEDAAVLTAELISLGREAAKLKGELRSAQEAQKKAEKV